MNVVRRLVALRDREHQCTVQTVEALIELDRTRAYVGAGYDSVWRFLVDHLGYSNAAASRRFKAMRCAQHDARVLDMLRARRTNLSCLAVVERSLREATDRPALLHAIDGARYEDVQVMVARLDPMTKPRESVRRVAVEGGRDGKNSSEIASLLATGPLSEALASRPSGRVANANSRMERTSESELAASVALEDRVVLRLSLSADDFALFQRARTLLSAKLPTGVSLEDAVLELARFFVTQKDPRVRAQRRRRKATAPPRSRSIPRALRDEVIARDDGRCSYVSQEGVRCNSTHDVEVDHITPFAVGGRHVLENLRVLCRTHNLDAARKWFGARVPAGRGGAGDPLRRE